MTDFPALTPRLIPMPQLPTPKTDAERMVDKFREIARKLELKAHSQDDFPAWFLELPSGEPFHIHFIGSYGPFVRFDAMCADDDTVDYVLAAPESVVIRLRTIPSDSDEPRRPIGFGEWPSDADEEQLDLSP